MRKAQIEITNIMFMHIIGLVGILTFTLLFISLITNVGARAEGLAEETTYFNYARRMISSEDCFAYNHIETYYNGVNFESHSRVLPGVLDFSKLENYNNRNCLRYDYVSGSIFGDPTNALASYPVVFYEVTVQDLSTGEIIEFTNNVYKTFSQGIVYPICEVGICESSCYYDCNELQNYIETGEIGDSLKCGEIEAGIVPNPRVNCWLDEFNDIARNVEPYIAGEGEVEFNCSIASVLLGTTNEAGVVAESNIQYPVILRYQTGYDSFEENPALFNVHFCAIKIPTACDEFFSNQNFGIYETPIYDEEYCNTGGLPLI